MNDVTLTIPEPIYRRLESLAENEGVSLNQYLLIALTAHAALGIGLKSTSSQNWGEQREEFLTLLQHLGAATEEESERALGERAQVDPEPDLSPEVATRFRELIDEKAKVRDAR